MPGWVAGLSFEVRAGESSASRAWSAPGRTELFEALLGLRPRSSGPHRARRPARVELPQPARRDATTASPTCSEDRKGKGLHVDLGLRENLTLMTLERYAHPLARARSRSAPRWTRR